MRRAYVRGVFLFLGTVAGWSAAEALPILATEWKQEIRCDGGRSVVRTIEGVQKANGKRFLASLVRIDGRDRYLVLLPDAESAVRQIVNIYIDEGGYHTLSNAERDTVIALTAPNLSLLLAAEENDCVHTVE